MSPRGSPLAGMAWALCVTALLTWSTCVESAATNPEWRAMVVALTKKKAYSQFLKRLAIADRVAGLQNHFATRLVPRGYTVTFFVPSDAVFAASPRYRLVWNSRRCSTAARPQLCYVPLIQFMMFIKKTTPITFVQINQAPLTKYWNSWQGDAIQKFRSPRSKYGFIIGPQVGCGYQCASRVSGGAITPNIFVGRHILVHAIGSLLAPPSVWPNGFN